MKHSTFFPLKAAILLAACHDATAPEPESLRMTESTETSLAIAIDDSSDVWTMMALDDAAARLTAGIADDVARTQLTSALRGLAGQLRRSERAAVHGEREPAKSAYEAARSTLARLHALGDEALAPELDAIGLALDQAERFVARRR